MFMETNTPKRDLNKSNGVFINVQWDCPKQIIGKQPVQLVPVLKGKAHSCEVYRKQRWTSAANRLCLPSGEMAIKWPDS